MADELRKKKSDYLLELALEEQLEHDADMVKYQADHKSENPHIFSAQHHKRMKKIFKRADRVEKKSQHHRRHMRMAAGVALFVCISAVTITQVEAFRLPVMRYFYDIKEKSTMFGVIKDAEQISNKSFEVYEPNYVPDGFTVLEVTKYEEDQDFIIQYLNEEKQQEYRFYFFNDLESVAIDTEGGTIEELKINGNQTYLIQKKERIRILMYKNNVQCILIGNIPRDEAIKVMESIQ